MGKVVPICWLMVLILLFGCQQEAPAKVNSVSQTDLLPHQVIKWRLATSWPKNLPGLGMAPRTICAVSQTNVKRTFSDYGLWRRRVDACIIGF